jgi:release factor glutamine methyltransferase
MLQYLSNIDVAGKTFLDVGTGSGAIAIVAAKRGAIVTAIDLSKLAVDNAILNAKRNNVDIQTFHSDLFSNLSPATFDFIFINPPYYPRTPGSDAELAWYCGEDFQYYQKLFSTLGNFMHANTNVVMVLSKGCDLSQIFKIAADHQFKLEVLLEKLVLFEEKNFLFIIKKTE